MFRRQPRQARNGATVAVWDVVFKFRLLLTSKDIPLSTSGYQNFKIVITNLFYLSRDAVHVHLGFAMLILTIIITKRKMHDAKILIPGFILSIVMELLDMSNDLTRSKVYPLEYLHDLVNTNAIPICLVVLCYLGLIKTNRETQFPSEKP